MELKRGYGDMAAHRLPVNDCPPRPAKPLDELRPQRQQVDQEQVRPMTLASITRGSPGVTVVRQIMIKRLTRCEAAAGAFTLIAMREHDQTTIPFGRHDDQILGAIEHALVLSWRLRGAGNCAAQHNQGHQDAPKKLPLASRTRLSCREPRRRTGWREHCLIPKHLIWSGLSALRRLEFGGYHADPEQVLPAD